MKEHKIFKDITKDLEDDDTITISVKDFKEGIKEILENYLPFSVFNKDTLKGIAYTEKVTGKNIYNRISDKIIKQFYYLIKK